MDEPSLCRPEGDEVRGSNFTPSHRLQDFDYTQAGAYFITIATSFHTPWLGRIEGEHVVLSPAGHIAEDIWGSIPARFPGTELDASVVMPNHLHGIMVLPDRPDNHPSRVHVGRIVRAFKGAATHAIRHGGLRDFAWQADYYEHVIRNDRDLH